MLEFIFNQHQSKNPVSISNEIYDGLPKALHPSAAAPAPPLSSVRAHCGPTSLVTNTPRPHAGLAGSDGELLGVPAQAAKSHRGRKGASLSSALEAIWRVFNPFHTLQSFPKAASQPWWPAPRQGESFSTDSAHYRAAQVHQTTSASSSDKNPFLQLLYLIWTE